MSSESLGYTNIARTLAAVAQQKATGELTLTNNRNQNWKFYFFHGRLIYGTGSLHRARRFHRVTKRHCPGFDIQAFSIEEPWEYQLLSDSVGRQQCSVEQAKAVSQTSLHEVLFSIVSNSTLTTDWCSSHKFSPNHNAALSLLLSPPQVERVLQQAQQLWKQWQAIGLGEISPYMAPVLKASLLPNSEGTNPPAVLIPFLQGQHTLWDIASQAQKPVTTVVRFLLPWVQRGILTLQEVSDLPSPKQPSIEIATSKPLIACIDDSPLVGRVLADILIPAGYRLLNIQDPLSGIATLVKHKPDLLFLDLNMPDTSGYNLCNFLRKTQAFERIPIIILTGQDGIIDRTRAKLVGASDFLSKPPDPQMLLSLVQQHLKSNQPNSSYLVAQ
jgi:two-component system, chemotaxis family, response regulator PixG